MTETTDALDFFSALAKKRNTKQSPDERTYPGSTPPRNKVVDTEKDTWLTLLPYREFDAGGVVRKFYTIGALAKALGKKTVTIRSWEQKGWLPPASFRTRTPETGQLPNKVPKGNRLYSQEQVVFLAEAYDTYVLSPRKPNWPGFKHHIKTQYPR